MGNQTNELTLLLLYLTSWDEKFPGGSVRRSWKGYPFEALNELAEKGLIRGSLKAKSVYLTDKGMALGEKLAGKYQGKGKRP